MTALRTLLASLLLACMCLAAPAAAQAPELNVVLLAAPPEAVEHGGRVIIEAGVYSTSEQLEEAALHISATAPLRIVSMAISSEGEPACTRWSSQRWSCTYTTKVWAPLEVMILFAADGAAAGCATPAVTLEAQLGERQAARVIPITVQPAPSCTYLPLVSR